MALQVSLNDFLYPELVEVKRSMWKASSCLLSHDYHHLFSMDTDAEYCH